MAQVSGPGFPAEGGAPWADRFFSRAAGVGRGRLGGWGQFGIQALGAFTATLLVLASMGLVFKLIDSVVGLRASRDEELKGLDICEHGMESYAGFQIFVTD